MTEAITLDELAEAFDHEIDGCYVGGTEFAVNVFAYVRDRRPAPEPSADATGPAEALGRLVHEVRLACEAARAEAEGREKFRLGTWEDRGEDQRELDMAIGAAVAAAERERAERAEAERDAFREQARILGEQKAEWLCEPCKTIHPWRDGDRFTAACPDCGSLMVPTSVPARALREARERAERTEAALRRHTHTGTDAKGTFCVGCLEPAPCPDAALCGEPS